MKTIILYGIAPAILASIALFSISRMAPAIQAIRDAVVLSF